MNSYLAGFADTFQAFHHFIVNSKITRLLMIVFKRFQFHNSIGKYDLLKTNNKDIQVKPLDVAVVSPYMVSKGWKSLLPLKYQLLYLVLN